MKLLSIARTSTFIITFLTTIPLFIKYLGGIASGKFFMIHIHVWIGLLFYIFAITSMVLQRKQKKKMMMN
jgi:hypothetical protein